MFPSNSETWSRCRDAVLTVTAARSGASLAVASMTTPVHAPTLDAFNAHINALENQILKDAETALGGLGRMALADEVRRDAQVAAGYAIRSFCLEFLTPREPPEWPESFSSNVDRRSWMCSYATKSDETLVVTTNFDARGSEIVEFTVTGPSSYHSLKLNAASYFTMDSGRPAFVNAAKHAQLKEKILGLFAGFAAAAEERRGGGALTKGVHAVDHETPRDVTHSSSRRAPPNARSDPLSGALPNAGPDPFSSAPLGEGRAVRGDFDRDLYGDVGPLYGGLTHDPRGGTPGMLVGPGHPLFTRPPAANETFGDRFGRFDPYGPPAPGPNPPGTGTGPKSDPDPDHLPMPGSSGFDFYS